MFKYLIFFFFFITLSSSCMQEYFLLTPMEGTWEKTNFWIDDASIVFEATFDFDADNTFRINASVVDKGNNTYTLLDLGGEWTYSEMYNTLTLKYLGDGLLTYYFEESMNSETYDLQIENNTMSINCTIQGKDFKMVLERQN